MAPRFYPIASISEMTDGFRRAVEIGNTRLLLIQTSRGRFLLENKCGHFGVPLEDGQITESTIICSQHGIEFDLESGAIVNRPWENCEPVRIFALEQRDGVLGVEIDTAEE